MGEDQGCPRGKGDYLDYASFRSQEGTCHFSIRVLSKGVGNAAQRGASVFFSSLFSRFSFDIVVLLEQTMQPLSGVKVVSAGPIIQSLLIK